MRFEYRTSSKKGQSMKKTGQEVYRRSQKAVESTAHAELETPLFSLQLQSGSAFHKKSISITRFQLDGKGKTRYIIISKREMREILELWPDIVQEG